MGAALEFRPLEAKGVAKVKLSARLWARRRLVGWLLARMGPLTAPAGLARSDPRSLAQFTRSLAVKRANPSQPASEPASQPASLIGGRWFSEPAGRPTAPAASWQIQFEPPQI